MDVEGSEYIDLLGSAAVANVGHGNHEVVDSIKKKINDLIHYTPAAHSPFGSSY
ncbi:aminotransferase class III-fold pyridoxal phosphate-dependent enzyme [Candidatus Bipolaricaulota bacterium]|nr:aminotransferase class III-fold pyridoxal phosphate-dependent enzyme [Candidatus Bipolaricaulota bacterium]